MPRWLYSTALRVCVTASQHHQLRLFKHPVRHTTLSALANCVRRAVGAWYLPVHVMRGETNAYINTPYSFVIGGRTMVPLNGRAAPRMYVLLLLFLRFHGCLHTCLLDVQCGRCYLHTDVRIKPFSWRYHKSETHEWFLLYFFPQKAFLRCCLGGDMQPPPSPPGTTQTID